MVSTFKMILGKIIDRFIGIQQIKDSSAIGIISTIEDHFG